MSHDKTRELKKTYPVLIQEGEWIFYQGEDDKWRWSVSFYDGRITTPQAFEKRIDAIEDARSHGYGRGAAFKALNPD